MADNNLIRYKVNSNGSFVKELSTTTIILSEPSVLIKDSVFQRRDHFEERLNATTTSIELNITLQNNKSQTMTRSVDTTFLVGKDTI